MALKTVLFETRTLLLWLTIPQPGLSTTAESLIVPWPTPSEVPVRWKWTAYRPRGFRPERATWVSSWAKYWATPLIVTGLPYWSRIGSGLPSAPSW